MANTGFFHHVGTFLLFAACILLVVASISAPVVDHLALLRVRLGNATASQDSALTFGTFGYCLLDAADGHDYCSRAAVGYSPAAVLAAVRDGTPAAAVGFSLAKAKATRGLTRAMVLHPVGAGLAFLAFVLAAGAGVVGSLAAALVAALALLVALVVLITDFVLFRIVRDRVNRSTAGAAHAPHARFGVALWLVLAAAAALLVGGCVVLLSCCSARLHRRRSSAARGPAAKADPYVVPATRRRRRFWGRR